MKTLTFFLTFFALFVLVGNVSADEPAPQYDYSVDGDGVRLVMLGWGDEEPYASAELREQYEQSGVYNTETDALIYPMQYAYDAVISADGRYLTILEIRSSFGGSVADATVIHFLENGEPFATVTTKELVEKPEELFQTVSHFAWLEDWSFSQTTNLLYVETIPADRYIFDITTGELRAGEVVQPQSDMPVVTIALVVGVVLVVGLFLWRQKNRMAPAIMLLFLSLAGCNLGQTPPPVVEIPSCDFTAIMTDTPDNDLFTGDVPISTENLPTLTETNRIGIGNVNRMTVTPDGKAIALATNNGYRLYSAETLASLGGGAWGETVYDIAFSPNCAWMSYVTDSPTPNIRRVADNAVWEIDLALPIDVGKPYDLEANQYEFEQFRSVTLTNGAIALLTSEDELEYWDIEANKRIFHRNRSYELGQLATTRDGLLFALSDLKELRLYASDTGELQQSIYTPDNVSAIAFSPDGSLVATVLYRNVIVWRVSDGEKVVEVETDGKAMHGAAISADNRTLITANSSRELSFWHVRNGRLDESVRESDSYITQFAVSPDSRTAIALTDQNELQRWDLPNRSLGSTATIGTNYRALAISPDDTTLALINGTTGVDQRESAEHPTTFNINGDITSLAYVPNGQIAVATTTAPITLFAADGTPLRTFGDSDSSGLSLAISPDGTLLAGGTNSDVRVWRVADGSQVWMVDRIEEPMTSVIFSPDGTQLLAGGWEGAIKVYDAADGREQHSLYGHGHEITDLAFSHDGRMVASSSTDETVRLWDSTTWQEIGVLTHPIYSHSITSVAFSADDTLLAIGSYNNVSLWQVSEQSELIELAWAAQAEFDVAFSADGATLVAAGRDGLFHTWAVAP